MDQKIERIALGQGPYGEIILAVTPFSKGEAIFYLSGEIIDHPTKYTIQLGANRHVLTLDSLWKCMNHGCTPNVRIDVDKREMVAARDIAAGEELNFNYNTTEWSMTSAFPCGCGSPDCAGDIRGFRYLTEAQREKIRPFISPYIAKRWAEAVNGSGGAQEDLDVLKLKPEVNILIPYFLQNGAIVSPEYDTAAFKAELREWFEPLGLAYVWRAVTHDTLQDVIGDLVQRSKETRIVVLNFCDGIDEAGSPGLTVVKALTAAGLPFSGANAAFYDTTTSKLATKRLLQASGVPTGKWVEINDESDIARAAQDIGYPLFVKPDKSAGSFGIGIDSVCYDAEAVRKKVAKLRAENYFKGSAIFAEPFIEGREFTALVIEEASQPLGLYVLPPGERVFDKRAPSNQRFLAYERYWELPEENRILPPGEPYYWYAAPPAEFVDELSNIARRAVRAVDGSGYARVDIRRSEADGKFYVLEVNAQCGLSGDDSATCGSLLKLARRDIRDIIVMILNHALNR